MNISEPSKNSNPLINSIPCLKNQPRLNKSLQFWRVYFKSPATVIAVVFLAIIIITGIFASDFSPYDQNKQMLRDRMKPPLIQTDTGLHLLGTDALGRDILSRVIWGSRVSLLIGVTSVFVAGTLGVVLGLIAGYFGGIVDSIIMRLTDIQLAIPFLIFALAVIAVLGSGLLNIIIVLGITGWVNYARIVRGETLRIREEEYIQVAIVIGASPLRIIFKHILPNVMSSIIVMASLQVARMILMESSLSYLGLGVPVEITTWGRMVADGRDYLAIAPWIASIPGLFIFLTVIAINVAGDRLRDILDPKQKKIAEIS